MINKARTYFEKNIDNNLNRLQLLKKESGQIATIRTLIFIISVAALVYFISNELQPGIWLTILIFIPLFTSLFIRHQKINRNIQFTEILLSINESEIKKMDGDHHGLDQGQEFMEEDHPYLKDLDIFGSNSAYQYLNRATTMEGRELLANWLKKRTTEQEILKRQQAVKELAQNPDWLQNFQAEGMMDKNAMSNDKDIVKYLSGFQNKSITSWHLIIWIGLITFMVAGTILVATNIIGVRIWIFFFVMNVLFLLSIRKEIKNAYQSTKGAASVFRNHFNRIVLIEQHSVTSEKLIEIRDSLSGSTTSASIALKRLSRILSSLDNMGNMMYQIINFLMMLDMAILFSVERWKRIYGSHLEDWLSAIHETESLVSLAGFTYANPGFSFPVISNDIFKVEGADLGHPLIHTDKRIVNDFYLAGQGNIAIITGSNMAGKSTFLRTIGLNIVLGLGGAPVCASSMTIPDILVFTSMRTEDNLEKNMSSFYAELERIRQLIGYASDEPILFLLDEILKGTNSHDRHAGAISLIRQLTRTKTFGLVSTHDVDLAEQVKKDNNIVNFSFDSQIDGDQINFDFKIKEGICKNFNASQLMKKMGIKLEPDN